MNWYITTTRLRHSPKVAGREVKCLSGYKEFPTTHSKISCYRALKYGPILLHLLRTDIQIDFSVNIKTNLDIILNVNYKKIYFQRAFLKKKMFFVMTSLFFLLTPPKKENLKIELVQKVQRPRSRIQTDY